MLAYAVERAGAHPQDIPPEVIRVPLDLGVEVADGGVLGAQELVGVVQVLPGLFDRPLRIVVEPLRVDRWRRRAARTLSWVRCSSRSGVPATTSG